MNYGLLTAYILIFINLLWVSHKHGQPQDEDYNFWITLISSLISIVIYWWIAGWRFI
jgi:hypothetical protein